MRNILLRIGISRKFITCGTKMIIYEKVLQKSFAFSPGSNTPYPGFFCNIYRKG